ncbi:dormancy-associated protein homolog 4 isoform X2 [Coffea arabica]|uniref:Dormancy-associated protein homolog 4 isoform X2 n=1 Tax=Coffea arabica TaxID=13443 RepID=A0A6P6X980_COFAR|nr:dormancy-associated protein homolog 4-like isoform X2 [Coffea arabica]
MGFLHKLWDETLAGPTPESGLGKLRKYNSFSGARPSAPAAPATMMMGSVDDHLIPVSRSITILRGNSPTMRYASATPDSGSVPSSPAASASTTPTSPLSPTAPGHGGNFKKLTRRKSNSAALQPGEPKSPAGYDWIVLSALDR